MEDPLHPFELHALIPLSFLGFDISLNKAVLTMWVVVGVVVVGLLWRAGSRAGLVPTKLQSLAELLIDFIRGIISRYDGKRWHAVFPANQYIVPFYPFF